MTNIKQDRDSEYRNIILTSTKPFEFLNQLDAGPIRWLGEEIRNGKKDLKYNSVDFIIVKLITKNEKFINYRKKKMIDIYVIGSFRTDFIPTMKVANAFAEFYLEMRIMPNIITISKRDFMLNIKYSMNKIYNGIIIYDRERNLY